MSVKYRVLDQRKGQLQRERRTAAIAMAVGGATEPGAESEEAMEGQGGWADAIAGLRGDQPAAGFCAGGGAGNGARGESGEGTPAGDAAASGGEDRGTAFMLDELRKVGEVLVEVGSPSSSRHAWGPRSIGTEEELESCLERLGRVALERGKADVSVLRRRAEAAEGGRRAHAADVEVRRRAGNPLEVRVAVVGNVDSGKSTMVGVLTRSMLDDGRGAARRERDHTLTHTLTHAHTHEHTHKHTCMHMNTKSTHTQVHIMHMHTHAHTCTHIHAYEHTQTYR